MTTKEQLRKQSGAAYRCPTFEFMWSEIEKREEETVNIGKALREVIANREEELDGAVMRIKELEIANKEANKLLMDAWDYMKPLGKMDLKIAIHFKEISEKIKEAESGRETAP